ncbi:hypothetical protein ACVWZD_004401 [Streptomyces sp. TE3672]|nr:hypothetical protein EES42_29400 [Streptomyces sp. ADI95-17]
MEEDVLTSVIGCDEAVTPSSVEPHNATRNHTDPQKRTGPLARTPHMARPENSPEPPGGATRSGAIATARGQDTDGPLI